MNSIKTTEADLGSTEQMNSYSSVKSKYFPMFFKDKIIKM